MQKILIICGATATGKSALAVQVAQALNTEIVSADSQLIYKGLNIGTAKPTVAERGGIKHHMIDVVSPQEEFSVSDYREMALPLIDNLLSRGKMPIICGGTGFYIYSLLYNLSYGNAVKNNDVREKYNKILLTEGKEVLHKMLAEVDAETAQKLHVNDTKRVIRALEIFETSGKKKSLQNDTLNPNYEYVAVEIDYPRNELYSRINCRVDMMFNSGLVNEVKSLLARGIDLNYQCMQAIGYKEVVQSLQNGDDESTMRDIIKQNTRHYAKRQITFFKKLPNLVKLTPQDNMLEKVLEML